MVCYIANEQVVLRLPKHVRILLNNYHGSNSFIWIIGMGDITINGQCAFTLNTILTYIIYSYSYPITWGFVY